MKLWLPMVVLPFVVAACASGSDLTSRPPVDAPPLAGASAQATANLAADFSKSPTGSGAGAPDLEKIGTPIASSDPSAAPPGAKTALGSDSDANAFPERRAIEALDVLARSMPITHDKRGAVLSLTCDGLFEPGTASLTPAARWQLEEIATALAQQDGREILVRGYTDSLGDRSESIALSLRRAATVRDYVVSEGAHADQIQVEGLGPAHPIADNATAQGRAANRRIEIVIRKPKASQ